MAKQSCSPDTIAGSIQAMYEHAGKPVDSYQGMNKAQKKAYVSTMDTLSARTFSERPIDRSAQPVLNFLTRNDGKAQEAIADDAPLLVSSFRNLNLGTQRFSSLLGEDVIQPFQAFMEDFYPRRHDEGARQEYKKAVKKLVKNTEEQGAQGESWEAYKEWVTEGGSFFQRPPKNAMEKFVMPYLDATVGNTVTGNFNVFGGNIIETVKVPALFGGGAFKHLPDVLKMGFNVHPDVKKAGGAENIADLFGRLGEQLDPNNKSLWGKMRQLNKKGMDVMQATTMLFDAPLKNWAYLAGNEKGGHEGGMRAIQQVSFQGRLADPMMSQISPMGRSSMTLMNYSVNTIRMYGGLLGKVLSKNSTNEERGQAIGGLVMYHIAMGLGAGTINAMEGKDFGEAFKIGMAQVPILFHVAEALNPDFKEWVEENKGAGTDLVKAANLGTGFVGIAILGSNFKKAGSTFEKAKEAVQDGDTDKAINQLLRGLVQSQAFMPTVLGGKGAQKTQEWLLDYIQGEAEDSLFTRVTGIGKQD